MCRFVPIFVIAVAWLALPLEARACSVLANPELVGFPRDDAVGVPTNVIPIYRIANGGGATIDSVSLVSDDGESVQLSMRDAVGANTEFVPASALEPKTHYTLRVSWLPSSFESDTLGFTTSGGPFLTTSGPPDVSIESYQDLYFPCGISSTTPIVKDESCIMLGEQAVYQYEFVDSGYAELTTGPFLLSMSEECLELRQRYPNGQLGEPTKICKSAGPRYDLRNKDVGPPICTGAGLKSAEGLVRDLVAGSAATTGTNGDAGTSATVDADAASASTVAASSGATSAPATAAGMARADGGTTAASAPHAPSDTVEVAHAAASEPSDSGGCSVSHATAQRQALWMAFLALACASRALRRSGRARRVFPDRA